MFCNICGKYSAHTSDIDVRKFRVDGVDYMFAVCVSENPKDTSFKRHKDEQAQIEAIVHKEIEDRKAQEEMLRAKAKEVLLKTETEKREQEERVKRETEERTYTKSMSEFANLTQTNKRAMHDIYKALKQAYEEVEGHEQ